MQRYHIVGSIVNARPLTPEDRQRFNVEDARANHYGIFHPGTGQLLNTMEPEQFKTHYLPLDLSDTGAIQPGTPQQPAADSTAGAQGASSQPAAQGNGQQQGGAQQGNAAGGQQQGNAQQQNG